MRHTDRKRTHEGWRGQVERLYDSDFAALARQAEAILGDRQAAEDMAQEAFLTLLRSPPGEPERAAAWLRVVVRRLCIDRLRRDRVGGAKEKLADAAYSLDGAASAEAETIAAMDRDRARQALATLDERERSALLMRHSGYSYREVGEALGQNPSAAGVLLVRAMQKWRRAYERMDGEMAEDDEPLLGRIGVADVSGQGDGHGGTATYAGASDRMHHLPPKTGERS